MKTFIKLIFEFLNLTMSRYTHTLRGQESTAIKELPDLDQLARQEQQKQKATETDNKAIDVVAENNSDKTRQNTA